MSTVWKKAVEAVEVGEDTGDILAPLKRIVMQYGRRALRHIDAGHPERAEYYHEQSTNIERLINQ